MKHLLLPLLAFCLFFTARAQDSLFVTVHVIYGSKPKAPGEDKWFGGKWGGHIGLEVMPGKVVHFNPSGQVKAFRKNSRPGRFVQSDTAHFYCTFGCDSVKKMQVRIPVSLAERNLLDSISNVYLSQSPYPYAFFGMRCSAACYHLLSWASVYTKKGERKMTWQFFYPRKLRRLLIRSAKKNNWEITVIPGTNRRKWDHD